MKVMIVIEDTVQAERAVAFYAQQFHSAQCEVVLVGLRSTSPRWTSLNRDGSSDAGLTETRVKIALNLAWQRLEKIGATYKTHIAQGEFADIVLQIGEAEGCDHIIVPQWQKPEQLAGFWGRKPTGRIERLMELAEVPITVLARHNVDDKQPSL